MIANNQIKADIVADIKADTNITSLLPSTDEVREHMYAGAEFGLPAVRVRLQSHVPLPEMDQCEQARLSFSIPCFAEGGSSMTADIVAARVSDRFHKRYFAGTGWYSWLRVTGLIPAVRQGANLWRSEVIIQGIVYPTAAGAGWSAPN